jgi:hypothetical protein
MKTNDPPTQPTNRPQIGDAAAAQFKSDLEDVSQLAAEWAALAARAEARDAELEAVKRRFSETTQQQVRQPA